MVEVWTLVGVGLVMGHASADTLGELDLTVLDAETKEPIPVRFRITDARGRAPRIRDVPRLGNDFTFRDLLSFKLKTGKYRFTIERGPHYRQHTGILEVDRDGFDQKTLLLPRFVDMRKEGWFGGDLLMAREREDVPLLMAAEELDVGVVPTWTAATPLRQVASTRNRTQLSFGSSIADFSAGLAASSGGRLLGAHLQQEVDPLNYPTDPVGFARAVRHNGGNVVVLSMTAEDLPMLVAHDLVDLVTVFSDELRLQGDVTKPRHAFRTASRQDDRFVGIHGLGREAEHIYYQLLNCGLRIAPAAASGSGFDQCGNPPGYNRVYVACGEEFSDDTWWKNLKLGKSIISNGPVLRVRANQQLPGSTFVGTPGQDISVEITCQLATRQKLEYLELVKDGLVVESVRLDEWAKKQGKLPTLDFKQSGWFLVRTYAPSEKTFRCAMSAPFFVDFGEPRISAAAAEYFVQWVYQRARQIRSSELPADIKRIQIAQQRVARDFWQQRVASANAP